jgi:hypothetical protein
MLPERLHPTHDAKCTSWMGHPFVTYWSKEGQKRILRCAQDDKPCVRDLCFSEGSSGGCAEVEGADQVGLEFAAGDDCVEEAVLEEEL